MKANLEKLNKLIVPADTGWMDKARFRKKNKKWLEYSGAIARRVLVAIDAIEGMSQKKLAEQLNVSPQHVSKMLKGQDNLTLETIAKLSLALDVELISFPKPEKNALSGSMTFQKPNRLGI